jgi:hypothetical protein
MVERLVILPDLQICADVVRTSRAKELLTLTSTGAEVSTIR